MTIENKLETEPQSAFVRQFRPNLTDIEERALSPHQWSIYLLERTRDQIAAVRGLSFDNLPYRQQQEINRRALLILQTAVHGYYAKVQAHLRQGATQP